MDPTQIKPASLPVPAGLSAPEPFQQAPTLMGGATAGSQGATRVWGPSRRLLWTGLVLSLLPCGKKVGEEMLWFPEREVTPSPGAIRSLRALRRPCYITTDEAGAAFATRGRSRAFRWSAIESIRWDHASQRLVVTAGEPVEVDITDYPTSRLREMLALIRDKAHLSAVDGDCFCYVRVQPRLSSQAPAALADPRELDEFTWEWRRTEAPDRGRTKYGLSLKSGERTSSLPVPAGSQERTRVWESNRQILPLALAISAFSLLLAIICGLGVYVLHPVLAFTFQIWGMFGLVLAITTLYRPGYVKTDDAGITVTTRSGRRAIRWGEIYSASFNPLSSQMILHADRPIELDLRGYGRRRTELIALIQEKAGLRPDSNNCLLYTREDPALESNLCERLPPGER